MTEQQQPRQWIPLMERICGDMLCAGHRSDNGGLPPCLGYHCSKFEVCELDLIESANRLNEIARRYSCCDFFPAHHHQGGRR